MSVVICAYATARWDALVEAIASVHAQTRRPEEIVLVVDHNRELLERARETFVNVITIPNAEPRGLSGARNTGVRHSHGEITAFLDDDARAREDWLAELVAAYIDDTVIGTGGVVEPRWVMGAPARWLPSEFYWTVGCSYRGLPSTECPIRNPIGANMSFRRAAILEVGGFPDGLGRIGTVPLGCEETELSVRVTDRHPGTKILHVPAARVDHLVEPDRVCWRYFLARCWSEGLSKAIVTRDVGRRSGLSSEQRYVTHTLPKGVATALRTALCGDPAGIARAAAIVLGFATTVAGYVWGQLMSRKPRKVN